ncbi:DUF418 domain-containing protein [Porticoccus sp. W117]|uniref:DUF418 domain-containing protein n=1 Tax=Porticoccus sp. W117 TaxID=3054777 RepID=UPI002595C7C5|nr:DUF418 domain-containing protein [Porticoccus sp. W117]MDM3870563.1 DUF418 domain-containing protein [Porticoccus sp. W117]
MTTPQRIHSLDSIRGIAMLGILFMNIAAIALPDAAYVNPCWRDGSCTSTDLWVYSFQQLFFDARFMTLFCLMFGAGMALLWQKLNDKNYPAKRVLVRRLSWLLLFGALHGIFIWQGDILISYALAGLLVVVTKMLQRQPKTLITVGVSLFIAGHVFIGIIWLLYPWIPEDMAVEFAAGYTLSPDETSDQIALWQGPYSGQIYEQFLAVLELLFGTVFTGMFLIWFGLMILGIALYKLNIFHRGLAPALQWGLLAIGLGLSGINLALAWDNQFQSARNLYSAWNTMAALPVALAYLSLLARWCHKHQRAIPMVSAVGRMAFTFYIFQSMTMVLLFRWIAPELYGQLDRLSLFAVALVMTALQITLANLYLRKWQQGPLEKGWRYLTYRGVKASGNEQQL